MFHHFECMRDPARAYGTAFMRTVRKQRDQKNRRDSNQKASESAGRQQRAESSVALQAPNQAQGMTAAFLMSRVCFGGMAISQKLPAAGKFSLLQKLCGSAVPRA